MATLLHDIEHHAKDKADVVLTLSLLFATELNPLGWQVFHNSKGNNSWGIYLERDGRTAKVWHFTGYDKGAIIARNNYHWAKANKRFTIKTRLDVVRFAQHVAKG
jgi:hypothetical protein